MGKNEEGKAPQRALPFSQLGRGFWVRLIALGIVDSLALYALPVLISDEAWGLMGALVVGTTFINWVYLWPRARALRWTTPGMVLMAVFVVWPILYTFYVATTNWATGNILIKQQAIERLESQRLTVPPDQAEVFELFIYQDPGGELRFWARTADGDVLFGEPRLRSEPRPDEVALIDPDSLGVRDDEGDGVPEQIGTFTRLDLRGLLAIADQIERLVLDVPQGQLEALTVSQARLIVDTQRYTYDAARDVLVDNSTGEVCAPERGNFICPGGRRLDPGWRVVIGGENFVDVLTDPLLRGPLLRVFVWNVVFAALSVVLTLAVGLGLALALNDERLKGKVFYRSVYIIPYAIPAFISILVWRGLLNPSFGQLNDLLDPILGIFGSDGVPWLTDGLWAKVSLLLVNTWLGFPYMFLITTGALQAIPAELQEAARVDGAGGFQVFRRVTFPLLMVSIAPLLIGAFAFNFNNFGLIYLLTDGGPPILSGGVPVGETDILITFTFDIAVQAGRGNNFGLGSAITIMIFLIVVLISAFSFRFTRRLEEIYGSL